jgi:divalent metal cation (Fe/Co/Zn/Cd) transporter
MWKNNMFEKFGVIILGIVLIFMGLFAIPSNTEPMMIYFGLKVGFIIAGVAAIASIMKEW